MYIRFYGSYAWQRKVSVDKEEKGIFGEDGEDNEDGNFFPTNPKFKTIKSRSERSNRVEI